MKSSSDERGVAVPRALIAGLRGSGGKTLVAVGLAAVLRKRGHAVIPYKKGADYIDAAWLSSAAGHVCRNLDLYMVEPDEVVRSFARTAPGGDLALIEGNRGLFDGMDAAGTYSAAELAKLLSTPVILVCDSTKTTRTLAALVSGCQKFDTEVALRGVILNMVAGARHESVLRESIERYCGVPVLGAIPKLAESPFPERHLGLVPPQEHDEVPEAVEWAAGVAERHLDLDAILAVAGEAPVLDLPDEVGAGRGSTAKAAGRGARGAAKGAGPRGAARGTSGKGKSRPVRVGVFRDEAFQFYYPENLEAIESAGGEIVFSSPLSDTSLPKVDAIYIGGGFPETMAERLAENKAFRQGVAKAVEAGVPVYAECAGAVYLGQRLIVEGTSYPMAGALPAVFGFGRKPQGHGYAEVEVAECTPFYRTGERIRGHEFHYSHVLDLDEKKVSFAFRVLRGFGMDGTRDGLCRKNVLATYCHIHALGAPGWARSLVEAGKVFAKDNRAR
jgi:cobyrinic acid a,c-diamide synthase